MSDSLAPSETVAKRRMPTRASLAAAALSVLFVCNAAMAQVSGTATPTPTMGATSPLGMATGSTVSPTGIPLGSTEIASPGVSPMPTYSTGTIAMPSSGTTCSTLGTSPSGMYGSTTTYDGGGTAAGAATPATAATSGTTSMSGLSSSSAISATSGMLDTTGLSGMCGSGSSNIASSSTPTSTSPTTPGGAARTGIPLGSMEIGNLGVSSAAAVPTIGVSPYVGSATSVPTMPAVSFPTTSTVPGLNTGTTGTTGTTEKSIIPGG